MERARGVDPGRRYLFVSNHRDIALDSGFMNYALWSSGHRTSQIAVGDNLFTHAFANVRLNRRGHARWREGQFAGLRKTSRYIRAALESGESVWIAQPTREGRHRSRNRRC